VSVFGTVPGYNSELRVIALLTVVALGSGFTVGVHAAEEPKSSTNNTLFEAEFSLAVGGFFPWIESDISLGPSSGGSGQTIDTEKTLGLSDNTASWWINFDWRFLPRHQLQVEWFQLNRSGSRTVSEDFSYGDLDAFVGATTSSKVNLDIGRITYGYSVIRDEKLDVALLIGAHIITTKGTISASGSIAVSGVPPASGSYTASSSTYTFPLPHVGASVTYKIAPRWTTQFSALAFYMRVGDYTGSLVQLDANAGYQLTKNFGLGAGLTYFDLNLQGTTDRVQAEYNFQFFGPAVFGYATF
jgi:hypothetical protein